MRQSDFEQRVLELWVSTRVPFTRVNLQVLTGVPRKKLETWLDAMVGEGTLEVDSDDAGEMIWSVLGAERSRTGTTSVADLKKMGDLKRSVSPVQSALVRRAMGGSLLGTKSGGDEKSVIASGALSLVLGPVGWLYAAPLSDAVPAIFVVTLLMKFLPLFLLVPILWPLSSLAGLFYAWQYNSKGHRVSLRDIGNDSR
jgi:hypothetical protein